MAAVGGLVLVMGLLVSAHCEVRPRDPPVEEEEEQGERRGGGGGGGGGGGAYPPHYQRFHPRATETPPLGESGPRPSRAGNWCQFEQKRMVTMAVACGTEKYTIKSQSLCPSGGPNCQLVMYKLSTRLIYKQKQQLVPVLLWGCCPGHTGQNCEDAVVQQHVDPHSEQNDYQISGGELHDYGYTHNATHRPQEPGHAHRHAHQQQHQQQHHAADTRDHLHHQDLLQQEHHVPDAAPLYPDAQAAPHYPDAPAVAALPVPHMMALVMSQLQPVLEGFNRSLEHLSRQVGDLSRDVARLKSSRLEAEMRAEPVAGPEVDEAAEQRLDAKLDEVFDQMREVRRRMESQRTDVEDRLHSQHAMLHYNLTSFKTDVDVKLKRHQKLLQVSLQAMNATLAGLKLDQDQTEELLDDHRSAAAPPNTAALWEAVERLDNMVVNNTVKVNGLMEDADVTSGSVQQLRRDFKHLEKQINQTARTSQVQFMETGLEVEAAKEAVLRQVGELAGNLSDQGKQVQELEEDLNDLYNSQYGYNLSRDCDCKGLSAAVAQLKEGVANVTELANENRLTLDESGEGGAGHWGGDWEPAVEAIQRDLQQVKESLASEETRTGTLGLSVKVALVEVSSLKETDRKLAANMQHLSGSFNSLLKDVIRHSDVLELLLGNDVLEFLDRPAEEKEAHSIRLLQEHLELLEEQLRRHNRSITSLQDSRAGSEEVPSADQPSSSSLLPPDWLPGNMRRSSGRAAARERQLLLHGEGRGLEHAGDGGDLWNLEKRVEELGLKVRRLEEKHHNSSTEREAAPPGGMEAKLQAEVTWLKRGLEEHLRVFKNVFSNADVLEGANATLELDKLWRLVKDKDGRKEKKKRGGGGGGGHRSRRDSGVAPVAFSQSEEPLSAALVLEASVNPARFHADGFVAPADGIYLFVLTLDPGSGPAHAVLRRQSGAAPVTLHRQEAAAAAAAGGPITGVGLLPLSEGEQVRLELQGGEWAESADNALTVLLLRRTT